MAVVVRIGSMTPGAVLHAIRIAAAVSALLYAVAHPVSSVVVSVAPGPGASERPLHR
jgi:hypothetical protein